MVFILAALATLAHAQTDTILLSPSSLDLGVVGIGQSATAQFSVGNTAASAVTITDVSLNNPRYSASPTTFTVEPGLVVVVTVSFSPVSAYWHPGVLSVVHNGIGSPTTLGVTGAGAIAQPTEPPVGDLLDTKIAFVSNRDGNQELYGINYDGSGETNLTNNPANDRRAAWSSDASQIAFESDENGLWQIWVMDADGGGRRLLVDTAGAEGAAWTPDGAYVGFSDGADVFVVRSDGTGLAPLLEGATVDRDVAWSRDGTKIAWSSDGDIWAADADGGDAFPVADTGGVDVHPVWSPDGQWILFRSGDDVHKVLADGLSLFVNLTSTDSAASWNGHWSPDGSRIAYSRWASGAAIDIYTMDAAIGLDVRALAVTSSNDEMPAWSPFLTQLATPPAVALTGPSVDETLPAGTTTTPLTVAITDHTDPGHWHWQLGEAFAETGIADGTHVDPGVLTDTISGLVDGGAYTVYVALVEDAAHTLLHGGDNPSSRANVAFSVDGGGGGAITVEDAQGSAGSEVVVPITIFDVAAAAEVVSGIDLTVTYDPALLTPLSNAGVTTAVTAGAVVPASGWSLEQNVVTPGELRIVLAGAFNSQLTGAGTLVEGHSPSTPQPRRTRPRPLVCRRLA